MRLAMHFFRMVWSSRPLRRFIYSKHHKAFRLIMGQQGLLAKIRREMEGDKRETWWLHAASYGEYNVIRPIIRALRSENRRIVVTLFSPSGYTMVSGDCRRNGDEADDVFYLPWDTPENVKAFLDAVKPKKVIFAISEYWMNYLQELRRRHIPTYIVSMLVGDDSYLLKWRGMQIRNALKAITTFMVLDDKSKQNLAKIGFNNSEVIGDPLFDNAIKIAEKPYHNDTIEKFCTPGSRVFVAGSISDDNDLLLVSALANANRDVKFIVVPHEIREDKVSMIAGCMEGPTLVYSHCNANSDLAGAQVLVADILGALSRIYRFGQWAYVGGGFTPYLHSIIEPVVYGIPVAFGPRTGRKHTPDDMVSLGIGCVVRTEDDLKEWLTAMRDKEKLADVRRKADTYIKANANFTQKVIKVLSE